MNRCSNSSSVGTSLFSCAPWRARKRSRSSPQRFATWTERGTSPSRGSAYRRAAVREDPLRGTPSWTLPRSAATERALQRRERSRLPAPSFDPECREQAGRGVRRDDAWLQRGEPALGPRAAAAYRGCNGQFSRTHGQAQRAVPRPSREIPPGSGSVCLDRGERNGTVLAGAQLPDSPHRGTPSCARRHHRIAGGDIFSLQRRRAQRAGARAPRTGAVTFVQRFGGLSATRRDDELGFGGRSTSVRAGVFGTAPV